MDNAALMAMWTQVYDDFEPMRAADASQRVARRPYNSIAELVVKKLRLRINNRKFILAGGIGSGKSTELRAGLEDIRVTKNVLLIDLWDHYSKSVRDPKALEQIEAVELVGLLGLATLRFGRDAAGLRWGELERRFSDALNKQQRPPGEGQAPVLDVLKLASALAISVGLAAADPIGGVVAGLLGDKLTKGAIMALQKLNDSWEWKLGLGGRPARGDQDDAVRALFEATNALLDHLYQMTGKPLVLVVDGLDRVQGIDVFLQLVVHSRLLVDLHADLVLTLDLGLVQRHNAMLRGWTPHAFTVVPVAERDDPYTPDPRGVDFLAQVAEHRFARLGHPMLISRPQLKRLACYSAGSVRDFIMLVRDTAEQVMMDGGEGPTDDTIHIVLDQYRRSQEAGLNRAHIACLEGVLADPNRRLPEGDLPAELVNRQLLLAYPNESTWYLPHTALIWKMLRRPGPST